MPGDVQSAPDLAPGRESLPGRQAAGRDVGLEPAHDPDVSEIAGANVRPAPRRSAGLTRLVHTWFTRTMKLVLLGGGGFRTPAVYRALAEGSTRTHYDAVVLYDPDQARLDRIGAVLIG